MVFDCFVKIHRHLSLQSIFFVILNFFTWYVILSQNKNNGIMVFDCFVKNHRHFSLQPKFFVLLNFFTWYVILLSLAHLRFSLVSWHLVSLSSDHFFSH